MLPARPLHCSTPLARGVLLAAGVAVLVCAGCTSTAATLAPRVSTGTPAPSPSVTRPPTRQASATCVDMTPGPGSLTTFPLPPGTVSTGPNGAAGAGFWIECTMGTTAPRIDGYLTAALPQAGWQPWNPRTQNANGCGTEPNDYWKWYKGGSAVGYHIVQANLPQWQLAFCDLAYGH